MQSTIKGNTALINTLTKLCPPDGTRHITDQDGNTQHWFELSSTSLLTAAASSLKSACARLSLVSAYARTSAPDAEQAPYAVCYHFLLDGVLYNVTATITRDEPSVPSITPFFFNADWHEREMMELSNIQVTNQPNPVRLFLDAGLDTGVLNQYVPLSVMMNGACSKDLWESVLSAKQGGR